MARIFTLLLLLHLSTLAEAWPHKKFQVWIVGYTQGAELYHNGELVHSYAFRTGMISDIYHDHLRIDKTTPTHEFVVVKEGYHPDTLRITEAPDQKRLRFSVELTPNLVIPPQPWPFAVHVVRSALELPPNQVVATLTTRYEEGSFVERLYGRDTDRLAPLLDEFPGVVESSLLSRGYLVPAPEAAPEDFFLEGTPQAAARRPAVQLGVKVTDLQLTWTLDGQTGTEETRRGLVEATWYLFDPVTQKVVYEKQTRTLPNRRFGLRYEVIEDSFQASMRSAFEELLMDPEFVRQTERLGKQAIQMQAQSVTEGSTE